MNREELKTVLCQKYTEFGAEMGLHSVKIKESAYTTSIYLISTHALQLQIDWRENAVFLYVVWLRDNAIPSEDIIYFYRDGHECRKYIEELYQTRNPMYGSNHRYQPQFLMETLDYYIMLIRSKPQRILDILHGTKNW